MAVLFIYVLLATNFRGLNRVFGIILLLVFVGTIIRVIRLSLRRRGVRAPTGPLSPDERVKARAKLVKPGAKP